MALGHGSEIVTIADLRTTLVVVLLGLRLRLRAVWNEAPGIYLERVDVVYYVSAVMLLLAGLRDLLDVQRLELGL